MNRVRRLIAITIAITAVPAGGGAAAEPAGKLAAGNALTITFPDMPPTMADLLEHNGLKPMMTIFVPVNYDPGKKFPLLIFLNGGNGGTGGNTGTARKLCEKRDFVCAGLPLFKVKADPPAPGDPSSRLRLHDEDYKLAWPLYKKMLAKLDELVPNIDPAHRVLGGFSNGAHTTAGLIDQSDGEAARYFSAFFFVAGGGRLEHYDLLKGKQMLMVHGGAQSRPRVQQIRDAAAAAGAKVDIYEMHEVGHAFPEAEYPGVRAWLRGML